MQHGIDGRPRQRGPDRVPILDRADDERDAGDRSAEPCSSVSSTIGSWPVRWRSRTVCEPMYPAPPVTRTRIA